MKPDGSRLPIELRRLLAFAIVMGLYVGLGKAGISLTVAKGVITPVWAPSGIALAALVLLGPRLWPAVLLGAFVVNVTSGAGFWPAAGIAVGNTFEPLVGAYLLRRVRFRPALDRVQDALALVGLGALLSTVVAATCGVSVLTAAGSRSGSYGSAWLLWWFGDAAGILLVAPIILVVAANLGRRPTRGQAIEALAVTAAVAGTASAVFFGGAWRYPYIFFPFLLWAALRFRQLGAAASSLIVGALGTGGAIAGTVPIGGGSPTTQVQIVQALVGMVSVALLIVGATLAERERSRAELARTAALLTEAQELTHIGSWEWDLAGGRLTWSDELYRIYGLDPRSVKLDYDAYVSRIHPEDRARIAAEVERARTSRQPFAFDHRVVRPNGAERLVHGRGRVITDAAGRPLRMIGTSQDVTERRQAESLREDILSTVSHELRTPLTSVLGFAMTLQARFPKLGEQQIRMLLGEIVAQAKRLDRLLGDLLDVERMRRGAVHASREATDVGPLAEQVAAAHIGRGHPIEVFTDSLVANVDPGKFERILENLVANAVKHTPAGTPIELRLERHDDDLLVVLEDRGPGVPDELKSSVFELFNRGSNMLSSTSGTGIGLSLVARFAAVHDGRAWVEDRADGGASFRVLLPGCVL